jgi:hypothetical protein
MIEWRIGFGSHAAVLLGEGRELSVRLPNFVRNTKQLE